MVQHYILNKDIGSHKRGTVIEIEDFDTSVCLKGEGYYFHIYKDCKELISLKYPDIMFKPFNKNLTKEELKEQGYVVSNVFGFDENKGFFDIEKSGELYRLLPIDKCNNFFGYGTYEVHNNSNESTYMNYESLVKRGYVPIHDYLGEIMPGDLVFRITPFGHKILGIISCDSWQFNTFRDDVDRVNVLKAENSFMPLVNFDFPGHSVAKHSVFSLGTSHHYFYQRLTSDDMNNPEISDIVLNFDSGFKKDSNSSGRVDFSRLYFDNVGIRYVYHTRGEEKKDEK